MKHILAGAMTLVLLLGMLTGCGEEKTIASPAMPAVTVVPTAEPTPEPLPELELPIVDEAPAYTHIADGFAGSLWGSTREEVLAAHPDNVWHIVTVAGGPGMYQADAHHLFDPLTGGLIGGGYQMGPEHTLVDVEAPELYLNVKNFLCQIYGEPSAAQGSVYDVIAGAADSCREDWVFPLEGVGFCTVQLSLDRGGETRVNYGFSSPDGTAGELPGITPSAVTDSAGYALKEYTHEELDSHMRVSEGFNGNPWGSTVEEVLANNPYPVWHLAVQSVELAGHRAAAYHSFHHENGGLNAGYYRLNQDHNEDGTAIYLDVMAQMCSVYGDSHVMQMVAQGEDPGTDQTIYNVLAGSAEQCIDQWQYQGEDGKRGSISLRLMPSGEVTLTVYRSDLM